jgi:carbamoyl-phosphate synthase large subunit
MHGLEVSLIHKVAGGYRPNVLDLMRDHQIALMFNTPEDGRSRKDSYLIRRTAVVQNIPYYTTIDGAQAAVSAIEALLKREHIVRAIQEYHAEGAPTS